MAEMEQIERWLRTGMVDSSESPTAARARRLIDELVSQGKLEKPKMRSSTAAWLGDRALDFYLAQRGVDMDLTSREMDSIRVQLFSTANLGGGTGRQCAEEREEDVGIALRESKGAKKLWKITHDVMQSQTIPQPDDPSSFESVAAQVLKRCREQLEKRDNPKEKGAGKGKGHKGKGDQSVIYGLGGGVVGCRYQQTLNSSFSAVSKPIFATKASF